MSVASVPGPTRADTLARWLQVLLVLSLSVNLLIAGAVLGGAWVLRHHEGPGGPAKGAAGALAGPVMKFVASLTPERRAELHDAIVQHQAASQEFNKSMTGVKHDAADALLTKPFDKSRFEAALGRLYDTELSGRKAMIPATSAFVDHLSEPERAAFMQLLRWQQAANKPAGQEETPKSP